MLNETFEPSIGIGARVSPDEKHCELVVNNISGKKIDEINVELANVRRNGNFLGDILDVMTDNTGKQRPFSLNPGAIAYFQFASKGPKRNGIQSIQLYTGNNKKIKYFEGENIMVKFNIFSEYITNKIYLFTVFISEKGVISLEE